MQELAAGTVVGGEYRVERHLASGGMGAVYVAEQLSTGKRRALKILSAVLASDLRSRQRFIEEAKVGGSIDSEHVVDVIGAGVEEATGMPWLAMELLTGCDLDAHIRENGPMPFGEVCELFEQLAHALGQAHERGIIHRDLKPENLFLAQGRRKGGAAILKILDFGIAVVVASDKSAATVTTAIGSPLWIAPEQATPGAKLRASTDVWAIGLIAFFMLTAKSYWEAANLPQFALHALLGEILALPLERATVRAGRLGVPAELPRGFDDWFARCVSRAPDARFADAREAVAALRALLDAALAPVAVSERPTAERDSGATGRSGMSVGSSPTSVLTPDPSGAPSENAVPPTAVIDSGADADPRAPVDSRALWVVGGAAAVLVGGLAIMGALSGGEPPLPDSTSRPRSTVVAVTPSEDTAPREDAPSSPNQGESASAPTVRPTDVVPAPPPPLGPTEDPAAASGDVARTSEIGRWLAGPLQGTMVFEPDPGRYPSRAVRITTSDDGHPISWRPMLGGTFHCEVAFGEEGRPDGLSACHWQNAGEYVLRGRRTPLSCSHIGGLTRCAGRLAFSRLGDSRSMRILLALRDG